MSHPRTQSNTGLFYWTAKAETTVSRISQMPMNQHKIVSHLKESINTCITKKQRGKIFSALIRSEWFSFQMNKKQKFSQNLWVKSYPKRAKRRSKRRNPSSLTTSHRNSTPRNRSKSCWCRWFLVKNSWINSINCSKKNIREPANSL